MHRVQARLLDGVVGNRAKLNYLKLIWEEQKDKLCFQYIQKNKKKEYNQIIGDISGIDMSVRDAFLTRYLSRCKLTHSLAFFQWRAQTLEDPDEAEKNKKMFYKRIDFILSNLDESLKKKKTIMEETKDSGNNRRTSHRT